MKLGASLPHPPSLPLSLSPSLCRAGLDDPIFTHTLDLKMLMERWREEGKQEGETVSFFLVARARVDQVKGPRG